MPAAVAAPSQRALLIAGFVSLGLPPASARPGLRFPPPTPAPGLMDRLFRDSSVVREEDVATQANAVKVATVEGLKNASLALAASTVTVLGACKLFPRFNRSLSVSGKTALIVTPAFASFFLLAELKMNEFKKQRNKIARGE